MYIQSHDIYTYIYIYIHTERERESMYTYICMYIYIYIYIPDVPPSYAKPLAVHMSLYRKPP